MAEVKAPLVALALVVALALAAGGARADPVACPCDGTFRAAFVDFKSWAYKYIINNFAGDASACRSRCGTVVDAPYYGFIGMHIHPHPLCWETPIETTKARIPHEKRENLNSSPGS